MKGPLTEIGAAGLVLLTLALACKGSDKPSSTPGALPGYGAAPPPGGGRAGDCSWYSREGWLVDHDRRGEVTLWQVAGPPQASGQKAASVITWPAEVSGEPMITSVAGECEVNGIIYYKIRYDGTRQGWVDVDYLAWRRPATN